MDNCSGTNKNNYAFMFFYICVHCLKLYEEIQLSFLIPGHTKFSPDRCFGTIKNLINNYSDDLESYKDLINVIENNNNSEHSSASNLLDK